MKKKSIITKGLIASGMLYASVNASNPTRVVPVSKNNSMEINSNATQSYQWRVETEKGVFVGTSKTMDKLNKDIIALTNGEKIITKSITPVAIAKEKSGEKIYTWSIITKQGQATGQATSLEEAKNMVGLFDQKEVMKSDIIESKKHKK